MEHVARGTINAQIERLSKEREQTIQLVNQLADEREKMIARVNFLNGGIETLKALGAEKKDVLPFPLAPEEQPSV